VAFDRREVCLHVSWLEMAAWLNEPRERAHRFHDFDRDRTTSAIPFAASSSPLPEISSVFLFGFGFVAINQSVIMYPYIVRSIRFSLYMRGEVTSAGTFGVFLPKCAIRRAGLSRNVGGPARQLPMPGASKVCPDWCLPSTGQIGRRSGGGQIETYRAVTYRQHC
jgi:hypothetical protein